MSSVADATPADAFEAGTAPELGRAGIAGIGMALPAEVVPNARIAERLGIDPDWIVARTGVQERRHARPDDTLTELAAAAGRAALQQADIEPYELDLVLVASCSQDALLPNASPLVAERLGATRAGAVDVGAACNGFLSGLDLAAAQVETARADAVLLIGAELMSRMVDPDDRGTASVFGDGAGAALVTAGGPGRLGPIQLGADGSQADLVGIGHEQRLIRMRGQDTYRAAVERLAESTLEALAAARLDLAEVDLFVYHQANARILRAVGERLGLPAERVMSNIDRYGNTSAASIPLCLAEAELAGRIGPGTKVLLGAFGAGLTWGAGVIEWTP